MKRILALSCLLALAACAPAPVMVVAPAPQTAAPVMTANLPLEEVPLKLMSPSQSAARVN
ncbi:hypothetical protein [Duganella violaceipulchra]|uniref:Uncharacterized protein n=1 Tax=Duganella violaceipulchra TaxID=2849652 RepID=A0AA41L6Y8_9BURK|nr:hypothetical protein [Duganella violaceicalia]MBV6320695.1 hypothetical protein [Duganella violaceicalia]MCP2008594.1 hypothetical protein [Duganella violaceicalia]